MSAEPLPRSLVDTNVLVYALGSDEPRSSTARRLLDALMTEDALVTSTQVLNELYVTLTRKIRPALPSSDAIRYLDQLSAWPVQTVDYSSVRRAAELSAVSKISHWDALLIVAASRAGAGRLYTEDLHHGQTILGVEIVNPFRLP